MNWQYALCLSTLAYSAGAPGAVSYPNALVPDLLFEDASNGMREGIRADTLERATAKAMLDAQAAPIAPCRKTS
jgi:hypothetical protein